MLLPGAGDGGLITRDLEGSFRGDGNVLYYDWDGSYMGEYICQNTLNYKMCAILLCVNYTSIKLVFKVVDVNILHLFLGL